MAIVVTSETGCCSSGAQEDLHDPLYSLPTVPAATAQVQSSKAAEIPAPRVKRFWTSNRQHQYSNGRPTVPIKSIDNPKTQEISAPKIIQQSAVLDDVDAITPVLPRIEHNIYELPSKMINGPNTITAGPLRQHGAHPFFSLPTEVQEVVLDHLPYRSLLALRLSSRHFGFNLVTMPVLVKRRKVYVERYFEEERKTLADILKVPGVRSRYNRFWYQDPYYLSYLLWKLEQGDDTASIISCQAMEELRCYTCLELKGAFTGDFVRKFSARSRGLGGTKAYTRMCKDCMIRKSITGLHGRWWKEGYWRDRDIVRMRPAGKAKTALKHVLGNSNKGGKSIPVNESHSVQKREHGVCAKCRRECFCLYWGCATCFAREQHSRQQTDLTNLDKKERKFYTRHMKLHDIQASWYKYSGMKGAPRFTDMFRPRKFKSLRNLVGGRDLWLYLDWKKRQQEYEAEHEAKTAERSFTLLKQQQQDSKTDDGLCTLTRKQDNDETWSPYPTSGNPKCKNWEVRCSDCWRYNRPTEWFVSSIYESLRYHDMCDDCQSEVVSASAKRARRTRDTLLEGVQELFEGSFI